MIINYFFNRELPEAITLDPTPVETNWQKRGYHLCYAHKWSQCNKFNLHSMIDTDLTFYETEKDRGLNVQAFGLSNEITECVPQDQVHEDRLVCQMKYGIVFYTDETCFVELQQSHLTPNDMRIISGKFDISKWVRPINISFELLQKQKTYSIKRNDILAQIAFYTPNINESIKLNHVDNPDQKLLELANSNTKVTAYMKNTKSLIERGSKYLKSILNKS